MLRHYLVKHKYSHLFHFCILNCVPIKGSYQTHRDIHNISTVHQYFTNRSVSLQSTVSSWLSIRSLIRSTFWANVNSCRRKSVCLSVWLSSVFSLSVTFGHPTQRLKFSVMFLRHSVPWPSIDIQVNFTEIVPGEGVNAKGIAEYSDFGPIEGYISESVHISINH